MNTKYLVTLFMIFGLLFALTECRRLSKRSLNRRDFDDDNDNGNDDDNDNGNDDDNDNDQSNDDDNDNNGDNDLEAEKRAILNFLQDGNDASQFLDHSRRLFSDQKSQMKEAKKKYEEKCERLLHPRYCPDLATWPAWNQAWNSATGKK